MKRNVVFALLAMLIWTSLLFFFYRREVAREENHLKGIALGQAQSLFRQVVEVRSWSASHGGVYVPVSEETPPNPYLDVPNREIPAPDGRTLTLVNPSYMTRQIAERGLERSNTRIHITSLKPIRPDNAALDWEREALLSFEKGAKEHYGLHQEDSAEPLFRYMAPLSVEESCLECHGDAGYSLGDIRGGISVVFPADALMTAKKSLLKKSFAAVSLIWVIGLSIMSVIAFSFSQKHLLLKRLEELSLEDELTGLHNRRGFMNLASQQLAVARRWKRKGTLLFMDLDLMKHINDTYGHHEGDEALRGLARAMKETFRSSDVTGRYGGDEFVAFCLGSTENQTRTIIDQLSDNIRKMNLAMAKPYQIVTSVGTAEFDPEHPVTLEELIRQADVKMYSSKRARNGNVGKT